jgi:hypothetical protein
MMVPKKSLILAGAALAVLGATAGAQSEKQKLFKRAGGSVKQATLDLGTGTYTRGPAANDRGGFTIADFQNLDAFDGSGFGWLSDDTGAGSCRWTSSAAKGNGVNQSTNASDQMTDVVFFYCSNALDTGSGGAGGSVTLGFFEGYTVFGGAPTTAAAVVALTGMPANTAQGSFFSAGAGCYGLRVIFPTMVAFADGVFMGYSWTYDDVGTDGVLGNTYPFISCIVSCSGLNIATKGTAGGVGNPGGLGLGEDGQAGLDVFDQLCTAPPVSATFTFGTTAPPFAPTTRVSLNMQVQEAGDLLATSVNYNASVSPNSDLLTATKPILGSAWTLTYSRIPATAAGTILITFRRNKHPLPNGGVAGNPPFGRVLIAGPFLSQIGGVHNGTTGTIATAVPNEFAYCGLHLAGQARGTGGGIAGIRLSQALEGTIGTF